jgi:hypothetical protein
VSLGEPNASRYQGIAHLLPFGDSWECFKSVEDIRAGSGFDTITIDMNCVERIGQDLIERFHSVGRGVAYEVQGRSTTAQITLDMRAIHDFATQERHYSIQDVPGGHVITYRCPRYSFSLAILGARGKYEPVWKEREYAYDASRGSPSHHWVYSCLIYVVTHRLALRFGVGWTTQEAIAAANDALQEEKTHRFLLPASVAHAEDARIVAAAGCLRDVEDAHIDLPRFGKRLIAGYPWFYQVYTRDEAISVGALIVARAYEDAKQILFAELTLLREDGRIDNRTPHSEIASADGVGWVFLRLRQLNTLHALNHEEQVLVAQALRTSLIHLEARWMHENLVHSGWKETWMDTTGGFDDGRAGARIEIQALTYSMYCFMNELTQSIGEGDGAYYERRAALLRDMVRTRFFDPGTGSLADGISNHVDRTARPNVFLAAYAAPELFSNDEWRRIFSWLVTRLWLPWGGFATIDKEHLLFTPEHTGENDRSYHRGDSWFFVNNIASIVLGLAGFGTEREALLRSSTEQALRFGYPSHAAEITSASRLEPFGCFVQTWSAATYVEAVTASQDLSSARPGLPPWPPR